MTHGLKVSTRGRTIFINPKGQFDLSAGFSFWESLRPDDWRCDWYVFDMVEVNEIGESGMNWLRIFVNWAQQTDVGICIINLHPRLVQRCEEAGIELVDGEPVLRKRPAKGRSSSLAREATRAAYAVN
ncbi:MAG: hypothetical protein R3F45_05825 [Gammaproteobacteria bacterium]